MPCIPLSFQLTMKSIGFAASCNHSRSIHLSEQYAVFVICNGCTDRIERSPEEFHGMRVVEMRTLVNTLRSTRVTVCGDIFPRLYCDADISEDPSSFTRLVDQLTSDQPIAAGPTVRYGVGDVPGGSRSNYQALEIPIMTKWLETPI